ncbi:MAG: rhodanese-like domain-containing protein [Candidatus Wenzhouxiangella sp. M2_3B_020]
MKARFSLPLLVLLLLTPPLLVAQESEGEGDSASENGASADQGPNIYPNLAARLVEMGVPVIDARTPEEIEETGMIEGATNITRDEIDEMAELIGEDNDRAVVIYCGSGRRASLAINTLRDRGFSGLVNAGGYQDLREALDNEAE